MIQTQTRPPTAPIARPPVFETTDMYAAAALMATAITLDRVDRRGTRAWFVFADEATAAATVGRYYAGGLEINARAFADNVRALKSALHAPAGGQ